MNEQPEFVLFIYGSALMLLAAVCLALSRKRAYVLPWVWLGLFGLTHGISTWMDLLALDLVDSSAFKAVRLILMAFSFACLAEFGRVGLKSMNGRSTGRWVTLCLFIAGLSGSSLGWEGLNVTLRYALGFTGALWMAYAFFVASQKLDFTTQRRRSLLFGVPFSLCLAVVSIFGPSSSFFPATVINQKSFIDFFGFSIQLPASILIILSAVVIRQTLQMKRGKTAPVFASAIMISFLAIMVGGWLFADKKGVIIKDHLYGDLIARSELSAATIDQDEVRAIQSDSAPSDMRISRLTDQLTAMKKESIESDKFYLVVKKGSRFICPIVSLDNNSLGVLSYESLLPSVAELGNIWSGRQNTAVVKQDRLWGKSITTFSPIKDASTGRILAILGIEYGYDQFGRKIALSRLEAIIASLLALLLLLLFYVTYERQRESIERISASEEALKSSKERFDQVAEIATELIWEIDAEGLYTYASQYSEKLTGYRVEEIVGRLHFYDLHPEEGREAFKKAAFDVFNNFGSFRNLENLIETKDGRVIWVATNGMPIMDSNGNLVGYRGSDTDITEHKLAEEALKESEERYRKIFENSIEGIYLVTPEGKYLSVNPAFVNMLGYDSTEEMLSGPDDLGRHLCAYAADQEKMMRLLHDGGHIEHFEVQVNRKDGHGIWLSINARAIKDRNGHIEFIEGSTADISERKRMESKLRESEEKHRTIFENSIEGIYLATPEGKYLSANPAFSEMLGYASTEELTNGPKDLGRELCTRTEDQERLLKLLARDGHVEHFEVQVKRKDGHNIWVSINARALKDRNGKIELIEGSIANITERKRAQEALQEERDKAQKYLDIADVMFLVINSEKKVTLINKKGCSILRADVDEIIGKKWFDTFVPEEQRVEVNSVFDELMTGRIEPYEYYESDIVTSDGEKRIVAWRNTILKDERGNITGTLSCGEDVTERKQAESQIRLQAAAINAADDIIAILDCDGHIVFANNAFERQTGYRPEEYVGKDLAAFWPKTQSGRPLGDYKSAVEDGQPWSGDMLCKSKENTEYIVDVSITPLMDERGYIERLIAIARDVTEKKIYERLLDYQAHHDALTDLPNRVLFSKELEKAVSSKGRRIRQCAVLFIDLDRFKLVNDTMGHPAGDMFLVEVAGRLRSCLRRGDVLARMGGDEFTVLLTNIRNSEDAVLVANRMLERVSMPFQIGESKLVIGTSIGVSIYPDNGKDVDALLRSADTAMYRAKELGRNNIQFYSEELNEINMARIQIEHDLRLAIKRGEIRVYYQPILETASGRISGAEALVRWIHPEKGIILPSVFIPVAEETGMIKDIGKMVLETACKECRMWHEMGFKDYQVSVNVSPVQLRSERIISTVHDVLASTDLKPGYLNLEITETSLANSDFGELEKLDKLKALGVGTWLDDFGIGYSSLGRLRTFPIVDIKVDGSFIRDIVNNRKGRAMTESIIAMAHNLGIKVTAEWIESAEQLSIIRSMGCDYVQGYLISPPISSESIVDFYRNWNNGDAFEKAA